MKFDVGFDGCCIGDEGVIETREQGGSYSSGAFKLLGPSTLLVLIFF